jgi:hypothetical protein
MPPPAVELFFISKEDTPKGISSCLNTTEVREFGCPRTQAPQATIRDYLTHILATHDMTYIYKK